jgi:hypothetical protein
MLKRLLVLLASLLPLSATAAPKGFPEKFELMSLGITLTWGCEGSSCAYEGTYHKGDWFYTLSFQIRDKGEHRLWITGEDPWGNTVSFRYLAKGDSKDGFSLFEDDIGYPFSDILDPFSNYDFLEPLKP